MNWPTIKKLHTVVSPGVLVMPDRVEANIQTMIAMVQGDVRRLRPHVKTHKMIEPIERQRAAGISKFKAATLREARMVAEAGGADVLLAYQMVGPNVDRLAELIDRFPQTMFSVVVDDPEVAFVLSDRFTDKPLPVFIDVDCGMHRTGIELGEKLDRLQQRIESLPGLRFLGLHVYDGHLHQPSMQQRQHRVLEIIESLHHYIEKNPSATIIGGGSPTFPFWANETDWECSPGTTVFWDVGYGEAFTDLPFQIAVCLLTRVISKPSNSQGERWLCLDLGYKSVAAEGPLEKRVAIPQIHDAKIVGHSEEHLMIQTSQWDKISVGQAFLAFPKHICPTIALHEFAAIIREEEATTETWQVVARSRY